MIGAGVGALHSVYKEMTAEKKSMTGLLTGTVMGGALGAAGGLTGGYIKKRQHADWAKYCTKLATVSNFSLAVYISSTWYPIYQNEQSYQKEDGMNCTSATYTTLKKGEWHDIGV